MQDITLVTGISLTRDWAVFAYNAKSETDVSIRFQIDSVGPSFSAGAWGRWRSEQSVHTNQGPIPSEPDDESSTAPVVAIPGPPKGYNQCVFIKGFRVRFRIAPRFLMKAAAGPYEPNIGEDQDEGGFAAVLSMDSDVSHEQDAPVTEEASDAQGTQGTLILLTFFRAKNNEAHLGEGCAEIEVVPITAEVSTYVPCKTCF
jgi:hypothetical protein